MPEKFNFKSERAQDRDRQESCYCDNAWNFTYSQGRLSRYTKLMTQTTWADGDVVRCEHGKYFFNDRTYLSRTGTFWRELTWGRPLKRWKAGKALSHTYIGKELEDDADA